MIHNTLRQLARFGIVGILNTIVDFGVLNALIFATHLEESNSHFFILKMVSFSAAVINSFFWNKIFVFKKQTPRMLFGGELGKFVLVSILGLFANTLAASAVFSFGSHLYPGIHPYVLANIGAAAGSAIVLAINFFGYKFIVFKK